MTLYVSFRVYLTIILYYPSFRFWILYRLHCVQKDHRMEKLDVYFHKTYPLFSLNLDAKPNKHCIIILIGAAEGNKN